MKLKAVTFKNATFVTKNWLDERLIYWFCDNDHGLFFL